MRRWQAAIVAGTLVFSPMETAAAPPARASEAPPASPPATSTSAVSVDTASPTTDPLIEEWNLRSSPERRRQEAAWEEERKRRREDREAAELAALAESTTPEIEAISKEIEEKREEIRRLTGEMRSKIDRREAPLFNVGMIGSLATLSAAFITVGATETDFETYESRVSPPAYAAYALTGASAFFFLAVGVPGWAIRRKNKALRVKYTTQTKALADDAKNLEKQREDLRSNIRITPTAQMGHNRGFTGVIATWSF